MEKLPDCSVTLKDLKPLQEAARISFEFSYDDTPNAINLELRGGHVLVAAMIAEDGEKIVLGQCKVTGSRMDAHLARTVELTLFNADKIKTPLGKFVALLKKIITLRVIDMNTSETAQQEQEEMSEGEEEGPLS